MVELFFYCIFTVSMFKTKIMLHVEDVLKNACKQHFPLTPEKYAYVIANYNRMAEDDPTGNLPVWIEQLLDECDDQDNLDFVEQQIDQVFEGLKLEYAANDNVGGEFLDSHKVSQELDGFLISDYVLSQAIQKFKEWDGTEWFFAIKENGNDWEIFNIDSIEFKGKQYPVRTLEVENQEQEINGTYMIAPDSLLDEIEKYRDDNDQYEDDDRDECENVDNLIYHYVPDWLFYRDAKYIALSDLDMKFNLIQEII